TSDAMRPTFSACSPSWVTQPICTSSTTAGSIPVRSASPFSTCAASSSARTDASVPFRFPIGLRTASTISASGIGSRYQRGIEPPLAGNPLQLGHAAVLEAEPGAGDEVLDRLGDQNLARCRLARDPRSDRNRDSGHLAVEELALTRVHAGAELEPELRDCVANRAGAADRARRS